jgi:hypothetical protein
MEQDCYYCPHNQKLIYYGLTRKRFGKTYLIEKAEYCFNCAAYGKCTKAKQGRKVTRLNHEELQERLEREHLLSQTQAIYKRRQEKVELVFGHIKRNLGVSSFLLRGLAGVGAETAILSVCFNLRRMISILGQSKLIERLRNSLLLSKIAVYFLNRIPFLELNIGSKALA